MSNYDKERELYGTIYVKNKDYLGTYVLLEMPYLEYDCGGGQFYLAHGVRETDGKEIYFYWDAGWWSEDEENEVFLPPTKRVNNLGTPTNYEWC